jgi:hypothetical protein
MKVLKSSADPGIEAVGGIELFVVVEQRRLCIVEVSDIVLGRIFPASCVQQFPHPLFQLDRIVAFAHDIVLVKHVTEEVPVIEPVGYRLRDLVGQSLDPISIVAP